MPTQTKENYLKAIYFLSQENIDVSITELSKKMNISLNNVYKIAISLVDKKILEVIK